jgi:LysR family transcriptional regulator, regulator for metE and metH
MNGLDIEIRHLRLVRAVIEEGSLTRAGQRLHVTQSALSHQLRDLEERLGTRLFRRLGKRLVVTPAGERLLRSALVIEEELARARADVERMASGEDVEVRMSTECYTVYHWLPGVLKSFAERAPGVRVTIVAEATRCPIPALFKGALDIAVVSSPDTDPRLHYEQLFRDELVTIMASDHRLAAKRFVSAEDFRDEHLILYTLPDEESTVLREVLAPAGVTPGRISRIQLTEAIVELVKAGLGVSVLAKWAVAPYLDSGALVARPLTRRGFHRDWRVAMAPELATVPYVRALVALIREGAAPAAVARTVRRRG